MKKLYIILFSIFISLFFTINISADTEYQYVDTISDCYVSVNQIYYFTNRNVVIYKLTGGKKYEYSFIYNSGVLLRMTLSTDLVSTCNNYLGDSAYNILDNSRPVIGNTYLFTGLNYDVYYAYFDFGTGGGSISWGTDIPEPEPEVPHVPEVTIPNTDFYLFYDFTSISNFSVFSDYDFTSFTDFEKLTITIIVNIFYLGFIVFCIYIILKGLYKMLSWVFR